MLRKKCFQAKRSGTMKTKGFWTFIPVEEDGSNRFLLRLFISVLINCKSSLIEFNFYLEINFCGNNKIGASGIRKVSSNLAFHASHEALHYP